MNKLFNHIQWNSLLHCIIQTLWCTEVDHYNVLWDSRFSQQYCLRFKYSQAWCCVGWVAPNITKDCGLLDPEDEGPIMLQHTGYYTANNTASHPSRTESSTDLWKSQLERKLSKFSVEISRCFMLVIYHTI